MPDGALQTYNRSEEHRRTWPIWKLGITNTQKPFLLYSPNMPSLVIISRLPLCLFLVLEPKLAPASLRCHSQLSQIKRHVDALIDGIP